VVVQGFFLFNFAIYSYVGQLFVCLVKPAPTAFILASVFIGLNNFFSGLIVLPQLMVGGFYAIPYYITPGHYVYEGLVVTLFNEHNPGIVVTEQGDEFELWLLRNSMCIDFKKSDGSVACYGAAYSFVQYFFGGNFSSNNIDRNACILGLVLVLARVWTWLCLKYVW
jgi:hypothetical protein